MTQTFIVTGASRGIGEQVAYQLAQERAQLFLGARNEVALKKVAAQCMSLGAQRVYTYVLDLSDANSIDDFIEEVKAQTAKIDVLINNAGIGHLQSFMQTDPKRSEKMMKVNTLGTMYLTQQVLLEMLDNHRGHVITVASLAGKVPSPNMAVYGVSKAALISFQDSLRIELKPHHIKLTTINPGPVKTDFFKSSDPAGNYLKNVDFFTLTATEVAEKVVQAVHTQPREINTPWTLAFGAKLAQLFPRVTDWAYSYLIKFRTINKKGE